MSDSGWMHNNRIRNSECKIRIDFNKFFFFCCLELVETKVKMQTKQNESEQKLISVLFFFLLFFPSMKMPIIAKQYMRRVKGKKHARKKRTKRKFSNCEAACSAEQLTKFRDMQHSHTEKKWLQ